MQISRYDVTHLWSNLPQPTCGICVVFPLPVSPTTTQQELVLISFSRAVRAGKMGRERRWACRSAILVIFLLMHTLEQLSPHFSPAFTPARHYRRLAPASERCRRTKSAIRRSTTTKRMSTGTYSGGGANLAAEYCMCEFVTLHCPSLYLRPSHETCDSAQACCCCCAQGPSDE